MLQKAFPFAAILEASNSMEIIDKVAKSDYDVVITDLDMPGRSGLEAIQQVRQLRPKLPVLVLSFHSESQYALRAIKAGASGYLNKDMAPEELVAAIQRVTSGRKYISAAVAELMANELESGKDSIPHESLSDRELEVMLLLATGKSITDIADMFSISTSTVGTHRARILAKMNAKTNADLTLYAVEHKLI